jgi:septum formation protein
VELVLASTSAYRRALLERLGVPFQAFSPDVDERALEPSWATAEVVALTLARAKAESVARRMPRALVLGSDQVIDLDGERLGKPGTPERAVEQLLRLSGRTHRIVTAVVLRRPDGRMGEHVDVHLMRMRSIDRRAAEAYVALEAPLDCAGAYKIESKGLALFEAIEGQDYTAVIGLPLLAVVTLLEEAGVPVL